MTTRERVTQLFPEIVELRRHLHRYPELSFQEVATSAFISDRLADLGIPHQRIARTGIVAHVGSGERCVALRADIDALPITEQTGLPFASAYPGVMHACGHDVHTAMLLGAARVLKEREADLKGVVKLIFQPGEELAPGGASMMIAEGVLENPQPEIMFGQHVYPGAPMGTVEFVSGPALASADELYWTIHGVGAHAAQPHTGKDPLLAATGLVHHLRSLVTSRRNPLDPGVLTITSIHGGSATNIIPDVVELKGTLRAFSHEWREFAWSWLDEQTRNYCALYDCEGVLSIIKGYPPLVNDARAVAFAQDVAASVLGNDAVADFEPKMWAEDFAFYSQLMPVCFWMLGSRPRSMDAMPGLHNAAFAPDEEAMITGTTLLIESAQRYLTA